MLCPLMRLDTIPDEHEVGLCISDLARIFISHTASNKPFVHRLARLEKSHFWVWLDERDLIAGDPLPENEPVAMSLYLRKHDILRAHGLRGFL